MSKIIFFDATTTGLIDFRSRSNDKSQPHIAGLAAILVDVEDHAHNVLKSMDEIVIPGDWGIPEQATAIHGLTSEYALEHGKPEPVVVDKFLLMQQDAIRVSYGRTFDKRIIRIALKRYFEEGVVEAWAEKDNFECAMSMAAKVMGEKWPKLPDAYKYFTGHTYKGQTAMQNAEACMLIYLAINT